MAEPTPPPLDLDAALRTLQGTMADLGFVLSTVIDLRRGAFKLLQLLPDELRQLHAQIGQILPLLPGGTDATPPE